MNKKQEKALFGNVLPEDLNCEESILDMMKCLDMVEMAQDGLFNTDYENLLSLASSQREAIGIVIQLLRGIDVQCPMHDKYRFEKSCKGYIDFILSAVIQDTWEEVREVWEANK